jgi:beta-glucanase (GH16 family)
MTLAPLRKRIVALALVALGSENLACGNSPGGAAAAAGTGGKLGDVGGAQSAGSGGMPGAVGGSLGASGSKNGGVGGAAANGGMGETPGGGGAKGGSSGSNGGAGSGSGGDSTSGSGGGPDVPDGWKLSWSDEFEGAEGASPDSTKWGYDLGGDGWGNNELEYYTDRPDNSATDGQGHLLITLKSETFMNRSYTSARLITLGKFNQTYGRFEARIKVPTGQGVWPAFWMLGADIATNEWPKCGEIDIMEVAGREPRVNHGSLHGPGYSGGNPLTGTFALPSGALPDDFHLYAVEWESNVVRFYVDSNLYETRKNTDVPSGGSWVYDHGFFLILNVAIGGSFGGAPDSTTMLPQRMSVDYVRVYDRK